MEFERPSESWKYALVILVVGVLLVILVWPQSEIKITLQQAGNTCQLLSQDEVAQNQKVVTSGVRDADYVEQLWLNLNETSKDIQYNVTAVAQNDSYGFGLAYWLNGLSDKNLWYQVGIAYRWNKLDSQDNIRYHDAGFTFIYQVWNASSGKSVYPDTVGTTSTKPFNSTVESGDVFSLSLSLVKGNVSMTVFDWRTKETNTMSYFAFGASRFVGSRGPVGYPTSLMTEWYRVLPYFCSSTQVVYSNLMHPVLSGTFHADEWNFTGVPLPQRFNSSDSKQFAFNCSWTSINMTKDGLHLQSYDCNGIVLYANAYQFVTM